MLDEIVQEMIDMILSGKVREQQLADRAGNHTGEAERLEYRVYRDFLPSKKESLIYRLTGADSIWDGGETSQRY